MRVAPKMMLVLLSALAFAPGLRCVASVNTSRALSVRALSTALMSGNSVDQARSLCGITRLCGYLVDTSSNDIVLLGVVDPHLPALHLDDFVVALRNIRGAYNRVSGRTQYYAAPGCSIDPNPVVLGQLRDLNLSYSGNLSTEAVESHAEAWRAIGRQPQKVRVLGVPFDSHFAKVMVDADYYMKRIVNGSVALGIDGLRSLSDIAVDTHKQLLREGKNSDAGGTSMNRFWFSPGETTYEVRDGAILLRSCKVKLLTEEEFLNDRGTVSQKGRPNPSANEFARNFTAKYDEIAKLRPIYRELRGLFSFVAVARLIKDDGSDKAAGNVLSYLVRNYKVGITPVSRAVNGLTDIREIDEAVDTPDGPVRFSMVQCSCGGVSMNVRPKRVRPAGNAPVVAAAKTTAKASGTNTAKIRPIAPRSVKQIVLGSRKSAKALSWDVPVQLD